ncbi:hypothetical protein BDQ12DRAFT_687583 [Crucibulum laeve]|uniref:F-box domain-containing protein n=1 Tax=Crucibulum laeve TaxID=68775 RepID=A0A5C3LSL1_9AGAR|nr:hypothetical protein BDQ12DRAFT_687583 [Crucibulum laeve]
MPLITKWRFTKWRFSSLFIKKFRRPSIRDEIQPHPVELPTEIWLYIAEFIPKNDFRKLAGLNRIFYELVINGLYNELNLMNSNPRLFVFLLENLRNPSLAGRVRVLKIWPGAVDNALNFPHSLNSTQQPPRYRSSLLGAAPPTMWHSSQSLSHANLASLPSPEERQSLFLDVLKGLSHVEDCHIKWHHYIECQPMSIDISTAIWSAIGANLLALTINISADKLVDVIAPLLLQKPTVLSKLETLRILFTERCMSSGDPIAIEAIHDFMVLFINNHAPTLRNLHIYSSTMGYSTNMDLSRMFHSFGSFPRLETLKLGIRFNSSNLQDPSGLKRFLQEHRTIRSLELRHTDPYAWHLLEDGYMRGGDYLFYGDVVLPHILELKFGLKIPGGVNNPGLPYIARMCPSITSLILFDRSLSLAEVSTALRAFNAYRHLQSFSLVVQIFNPELLDLLAQGMPFLKRLVVVADTIAGQTNGPREEWNDRGFQSALIYRRGVDYYVNWKLQDIMIKSCVYNVGFCYMWACMQSVASIVPSINAEYVRKDYGSYSVIEDADL